MENKGNIGYGILGFCMPVVGLILFLVWKDEKPGDAKYAGVGALVGVIGSFLLLIVYFVFIGFLISSMGTSGYEELMLHL